MLLLLTLLLAGAAAAEPPATAPVPADRGYVIALLIAEADAHNLHRGFALALAACESQYNPRVVSPKRARGVMQLMPETIRRLAGDGVDLSLALDAETNIHLGMVWLERLIDQYGENFEAVVSAYNSGRPEPVFPETKAYIACIRSRYARIQNQNASIPGS